MTLSGPVAVNEKRFMVATRISAGKRGGEKGMKLFRARGSAESGQVADLPLLRKAFA